MMKIFNKIKTLKVLTAVLTFTVIFTSLVAQNNVKASSYVYDNWNNVIPSTEGLTYKDTFYYSDILNKDNNVADLSKFNSLSDMEVYNNKIYLLDQNKTGQTEVVLGTTKADPTTGLHPQYTGISYLTIIDQNFKYEKVVNEFPITDDVKAKLDEFYRFNTPLDKITARQFTATEFVNVDATDTFTGTVKNGKLDLNENYLTHTTDAVVKYTDSLEEVDADKYTINIENNKATLVASDATLNDKSLTVTYEYILEYGRAPYVPYSQDTSKAAVRLSNALGITVTESGIYIADTGNARILKINENFEVVDVYLTPDDTSFYQMYNSNVDGTYEVIKTTSDLHPHTTSSEVFRPEKIALTSTGNLYCIASNIFEGVIEFSAKTEFNRFIGKNTVTQSALVSFLKKFFTDEQLKSFALALPSMFTNISASSDGSALFATSKPDDEAVKAVNSIKMINTKGSDILKRNGYVTPDGDAVFVINSNVKDVVLGPSVFTAIASSKTGNYTAVDQQRGRLFTYDVDGNLLYITGNQPGGVNQQGSGSGLSNSIIKPVAVDYLYRTNDKNVETENVIVLDQYSNSILLYETTEFGTAVNKATSLYEQGIIEDTYKLDENGNYVLDENGNKIVESRGAESYWREVIKMNTNYKLAYLGIGKALNRRGDYKEAMHYFELAHSPEYYSKAFSNYRDGLLSENFSLLMTVIIAFVVLYFVNKLLKKYRQRDHKIMKGESK